MQKWYSIKLWEICTIVPDKPFNCCKVPKHCKIIIKSQGTLVQNFSFAQRLICPLLHHSDWKGKTSHHHCPSPFSSASVHLHKHHRQYYSISSTIIRIFFPKPYILYSSLLPTHIPHSFCRCLANLKEGWNLLRGRTISFCLSITFISPSLWRIIICHTELLGY